MYLFVYVPIAGRIAPASARNRIGPLSMRSTSKGGPVRALASARIALVMQRKVERFVSKTYVTCIRWYLTRQMSAC